MDGFVPEAQALLELEDNAGSNPSRDNYVSPLALSQPTLPIQHYDPAGTYRTPRKPSAKKNYGGYCEICNLRLNSYTQSKSHYEGKPHAKKVKAEQKRKESLSSDGTTDNAPPPCKKQARDEPVSRLYCEPCKLTFTSAAHAKDHYLGRNHDRVLHGLKPFQQGYFNTTTNKWQRTPPDPRLSAQLLSSEPPTDIDGKPTHTEKPRVRGKFHCELCNCALTCDQQLQSHLAGARHAKVLKKQEALLREAEKSGEEPEAAAVANLALRCEVCNVSFNSILQRQQHMDSKKHRVKESKLERKQEAEEEQKKAKQNNPESRHPLDISSELVTYKHLKILPQMYASPLTAFSTDNYSSQNSNSSTPES